MCSRRDDGQPKLGRVGPFGRGPGAQSLLLTRDATAKYARLGSRAPVLRIHVSLGMFDIELDDPLEVDVFQHLHAELLDIAAN